MPIPSNITIQLQEISHRYQSFEKGEGLTDMLRDFVARKSLTIPSLQGVSLAVGGGEILGLLGPNGAGKTTMLKVLSGLLKPASGKVSVLGTDPYKKEQSYLRSIGFVFGQKSQLNWDLPAYDTFDLLRAVYSISRTDFERRLAHFAQLLDFSHKLRTPVRKLSLGERMKAELICSLLHMPKVLFLDEPTIGLDVVSQRVIRSFIRKIVQENGVTVILTSHYMSDIENLADRICILQGGQISFCGSPLALQQRFAPQALIKLIPSESSDLTILEAAGFSNDCREWSLKISLEEGRPLLKKILETMSVEAISLEPQSLEETIYTIFSDEISKRRAS